MMKSTKISLIGFSEKEYSAAVELLQKMTHSGITIKKSDEVDLSNIKFGILSTSLGVREMAAEYIKQQQLEPDSDSDVTLIKFRHVGFMSSETCSIAVVEELKIKDIFSGSGSTTKDEFILVQSSMCIPLVRIGIRIQFGEKISTCHKGRFEAHATTLPIDGKTFSDFEKKCSKLNMNAVNIELPSDSLHPIQPMSTFWHQGTLESAIIHMYSKARQMFREGIPVKRLKLEIALDENIETSNCSDLYQSGVFPLVEGEKRRDSNSVYFEFHIKVLIVPDQKSLFKFISSRHRCHVSRNAKKKDVGGRFQWFTTLRLYNVTLSQALSKFKAVCSDLTENGFLICSRHREYAIHDNCVMLDKGWAE